MSSFEAISHFCSIKCHVSGGNHPYKCTRRTPCRLLVRIKGTCSNLIKAQLKQDAPFMFAKNRETEFCCTWYVQKALHSAVNCNQQKRLQDIVLLESSQVLRGCCRLWKDWWFSRPNLKQLPMDARFSNSMRLCPARYWPVETSGIIWLRFGVLMLRLVLFRFFSFGFWFYAASRITLIQQTKVKRVQLLYHFVHRPWGFMFSDVFCSLCSSEAWPTRFLDLGWVSLILHLKPLLAVRDVEFLVPEASTQHLWGCSPMWMQPGFKFAQLKTELMDELLKNKCKFHQFSNPRGGFCAIYLWPLKMYQDSILKSGSVRWLQSKMSKRTSKHLQTYQDLRIFALSVPVFMLTKDFLLRLKFMSNWIKETKASGLNWCHFYLGI